MKVPSSRSDSWSLPSRARATRSARAAAISWIVRRSASRMTGTIRPFGAATAMPTCATGKRRIASPVKCAFTAGWRTSAAAETFVSRSLTVGLVSPSARRPTSRSRSSSARVMSAETVSWKTGACQASVSLRAIVLRVDVSAISSTSPAAGARSGRGLRLGLEALDVLGDDPPLRAAAAHLGQLDALLAGQPARERRGLDAAVGVARGSGDRLGLGGRCGGRTAALALVVHLGRGRALLLRAVAGLGRVVGLGRLAFLRCGRGTVAGGHVFALAADEGDRPPHLDLAGVDDDLQQDAVGLGLDLLGHLVRVQLVERLALLDRLALALQPLDDRAGLHPLAQPRQLDLGRH